MKILISPDAFKGSLTAMEAAIAIEQGVHAWDDTIETVKLPVADGGEGTMTALVEATNGRYVSVIVADPLGRLISAQYGVLGNGTTCVIEMAVASGLTLLQPNERNPHIASTYGTGQLIQHALKQGFKDFIICLGGSATNDGGIGMLRALGLRLLDVHGQDIPPTIDGIFELATLDFLNWQTQLAHCHIRIACDVQNPLVGENGATAIFGPQKGILPHEIARVDAALTHWASIVEQHLHIRLHDAVGAGAAGGMGGALIAFLQGTFQRGIDVVLQTMQYEAHLQNVDYIITGEGQSDAQTLYGKAPMGIQQLAKKHHIPVILLSGMIPQHAQQPLRAQFDYVVAIVDGDITQEAAMKHAAAYLQQRATKITQLITRAAT
ncbi:glycerate kinase [Caryophanon tenue]|uniref:Glycerate kinase n=1 Tax=Caryophanon tenue TaxID=33978 RepID=A0A1C0YBV6_9BACL|nr:glycerate kinase [Caryophanon tenue]OCS84624.1 glycerate kinase [Caryophanon tenue]